MTQNTPMKVRLVAVAKDELAYLPEWIFHHLYFGIDEIDIYINNTSDGSEILGSALHQLKNVRFFNGDKYFRSSRNNPQIKIYEEALKKSRKEGITHLFYLDLDEYWVPSDLKLNIKECFKNAGGDAVSFEWLINKQEAEKFEPTISQNGIKATRAQHVKTMFSLDMDIRAINQHNIIAKGCDYKLSDGRNFKFESNDFFKVPLNYLKRSLPPAFVLHRMHRSQMEYVSLLGRGRPVASDRKAQFKDNRAGYFDSTHDTVVNFSDEALTLYLNEKYEFYKRYGLEPLIKKGQEFVLERFYQVLQKIQNASVEQAGLLAKLTKNITLPEVVRAFDAFIYNHNLQYLANKDAFLFEDSEFKAVRKAAFLLAEKHPAVALELLSVLKKQRPNGQVVNDKIEELKKVLSIK